MSMLMNPFQHAWQEALANVITDPEKLFSYLGLDISLLEKNAEILRQFPLRVTHSYLMRMQKGNIHDPLLKQVLPLNLESKEEAGYLKDPLSEKKANPLPGLLHKYQGRVLITLTSACAIHCRYCFRKYFPYGDNQISKKALTQIVDYIAKDPSINEVILSGGDPFAVNDKLLEYVSESLNTLPQVKRLRIHTRLPIVLPERITDNLLKWCRTLQQRAIIVIHCNHPQEIDETVKKALFFLRKSGVLLLNQTVLLKGINDELDILVNLSERLFESEVIPYYLHVMDKVAGTAHFDLPEARAITLHRRLCTMLPGYLVPKLVCEKPGELSKIYL